MNDSEPQVWGLGRLTTEVRRASSSLEQFRLAHNERHLADDQRLNLILRQLEDHQHNHHGRSSAIKQSGGAAILVALAAVVAELAGLLDLLSRVSLPF